MTVIFACNQHRKERIRDSFTVPLTVEEKLVKKVNNYKLKL